MIEHTMMIRRLEQFLDCGHGVKPRVRARALTPMIVSLVFAVAGCRDLSGATGLPAGTMDPSTYNTPDGAVRMAGAAIDLFRGSVAGELTSSGLLTDEFLGSRYAFPADTRTAFADGDLYANLQKTREQSELAYGALAKYAPAVNPAVRGHLLAIEAYSDVLLGDLYCSGVPLSTIEFEKDFTYHAGSYTTDVYHRAAELFGTAVAQSGDSARIMWLARVGLARALVDANPGNLDSAARVVATVPDSAAYLLRVRLFGKISDAVGGFELDFNRTVANREGGNGLDYITSFDPRTRTTHLAVPAISSGGHPDVSFDIPTKYDATINTDSADVVLASGVEARLIEAEADLAHNGSQWLGILNRLRTSGAFTVTTRTNTSGVSPGPAGFPDTTWAPGTGVGLISSAVIADAAPQCEAAGPCTDTIWYRGLHPLTDPGIGLSATAAKQTRVDLLFRERAFWLFATAHRQGDLRRLMRQYGREARNLYPVGPYIVPFPIPADGSRAYGTATNILIPSTEAANPLYTGCLGHD